MDKKRKRPEADIFFSIIEKLSKSYPKLIPIALEDFLSDHDFPREILGQRFMNQRFVGWFFTHYCLIDGKSMPQLARQVLELSPVQRQMLDSVDNAIHGFFEVQSHTGDRILLLDALTRRQYEVRVHDLDRVMRKGEFLDASLARTLDGDLFFFGGFLLETRDKKNIQKELSLYS